MAVALSDRPAAEATIDGPVILSAAEARSLAQGALRRAGASDAVAGTVSKHVVEAELAGHPSHGLRQIPLYCANAGAPGVVLSAQPTVAKRVGAITLIDGGGGLGYLPVKLAVESAAHTAMEHGVGVGVAIACGHAGRAGAWAELGVSLGCLTLIVIGGADPPFVVAAAEGAVPALHTNPLAIGAPTADAPLILDVATSIVAAGKIAIAAAEGRRIPDGWILDAAGAPSNDPRDFDGGSLLPFAAHKGFGLAAMIEALTVSYTGADADGRRPREAALAICLAADALRSESEVRASTQRLADRLRRSGERTQVMAPGDPETINRSANAGRVRVTATLVARLRSLAGEHSHEVAS